MSKRRPPPSYGVPALRDSVEYSESGVYRDGTELLDVHQAPAKTASNDTDESLVQQPVAALLARRSTPSNVNEAEMFAREIEHGLLHKTIEVPRYAMFREGSYDVPIAAVKFILKSLRLWTKANNPTVFIGDIGRQPRDLVEKDCRRATSIIRLFVPERFARRIGGYSLRSHQSDQLLKLLKGACKPFRLMDLPKELRDRVYEKVVLNRSARPVCSHCSTPNDAAKVRCQNCLKLTARVVSDARELLDVPPNRVKHLSATSRQVRAEVLEVFYSRNKFYHDFFWRDGPEVIEERLVSIGLCHLQNIRDLSLQFNWYKGSECDYFHMTWSPIAGFEVEMSEMSPSTSNSAEYKREMKEKARGLQTAVEKRRSSGQWTGTGIIETLLLEPDLLRAAMYGPSEWEEESLDERDAYQVAHGPVLYWAYMW